LTTSTFFERISWNKQVPFLATEDQPKDYLTVYPNPSSGKITIESMYPTETIQIFNQLGQEVLWFSSEEIIDVTVLENGLYFLKVMDLEGNVQMKRIIKK
ncbi:MAG: T9SS type A sorting domain-containing protein, partial [Flavobacteriaceae bacterium]|nr:T9SS type A sorting domain-containing protein [Flavobacteriaceae bacterium]